MCSFYVWVDNFVNPWLRRAEPFSALQRGRYVAAFAFASPNEKPERITSQSRALVCLPSDFVFDSVFYFSDSLNWVMLCTSVHMPESKLMHAARSRNS
jgi:hypothetical protein